jgi:DNA polymerase elongation subunit (family B)
LETEGLDPSTDAIFQIGMRDNRGFEMVLETKGDTLKEKRDSERINIISFFNVIDDLKPDIITAFNDCNFDWPFFKRRCERLDIDIEKIAKSLNPKRKIRWKESRLKLGGEQETYDQTYLWGYNVLDISHSVRRAQAINSDIKKWSLKYITQFSGVAKKNRVYVEGDKIHSTWADKRDYWFNNNDGSYGLLEKLTEGERISLPEGLTKVKGDYIVQRYLLDDLWETEQVDGIYNQASYLISKLLPTSYMRSSTMGTAGQWSLIMAAWSYENGLGIPELEKKRKFTGGLSRLIETGYTKNVVKLDFAALYPKAELTWDIFPDLDISGVMKGLLTYVVDTRDKFKFLTGEEKDEAKRLQKLLDDNIHKLTTERIEKAKQMIAEHKKLASDYDKKQLPLKILANSFFGAYGAPYIFYWGDSDCAEETTCRGRQALRMMVRHFTEKHGFRPLVGDTDGFNFAIPDNVDEITYVCKANHWKTEKYKPGQVLTGLEAVLSEFNEEYMIGRMGLDIDDVCNSTINFKRKNYANDIDGKIKLVGNNIKSKAMSVYIEEFIDKGIKMLLDGKGYDFIQWYNKYVEDIYNYKIPVAKIASKSKVKMLPDVYKNYYCKQKTRAGVYKSRQAHMELVLAHDLDVNLGDVIYYVNTGTAKSHSDVKAIKDKDTKEVVEIIFNCKLLPQEEVENNPNFVSDEYNVAKYIDALNKRITPLLVCFDVDIRNDILRNLYKDKKTKIIKLDDSKEFTHKQCELIAGKPMNEEDQDTYEELMTMEDKEIRFWDSVDKLPLFMEEDDWNNIRVDWGHRMRISKENGLIREALRLDSICSRLEVKHYNKIRSTNKLPKEIELFAELDEVDGEHIFKSIEWGEKLANFDLLFKYEDLAKSRKIYYDDIEEEEDISDDEAYNRWLESEATVPELTDEIAVMQGYSIEDKRKYLLDNGWEQSWDDDNWVPSSATNKEANCGIHTYNAFNQEIKFIKAKNGDFKTNPENLIITSKEKEG